VQKTDVRVIAATNIDIIQAIREGKFREDLYYRLNTVPINMPPLRSRSDDIHLLFRKFATDFAEKYHMPAIGLSDGAVGVLLNYSWQGNIRQLKNITEQISVIEQKREIDEDTLRSYLPGYHGEKLPAIIKREEHNTFSSEREILYKILFDMKNDMNDLKKLVVEIMEKGSDNFEIKEENADLVKKLYHSVESQGGEIINQPTEVKKREEADIQDTEEVIEESLLLVDKEIELIRKALDKYHGKRKRAAKELGISERTLYRKIKEYDIEN